MANSDPDLKWLIITASCQRLAEVNLSVYWTVEGSLSRVVGMDGRSSPRCEKREREREREREKKRVKGDTRKRKRRSDKVKGIEKYSLNRE